jgi:D-3-phosphoglycerate dehydrogenase / 2-oxoglutarate reductase
MKVLITDKMAEEAIELLKDAGHDVTFDEMDADKLLLEISKYDALMVRGRTKAIADVANAGAKGNLKVIGRAGIGVDNVDLEASAKNGIKVVNAPTGATASVAELAMGHIISLARFISKADSSMKQGEWIKKQLKGSEISGKTLGLIGSGNIAQHLAKIANGFGMKILVYSPYCTDDKAKKMGATLKSIEEICKESDFISLHLPHIPQTHYIINEEMLSKMKPSAYIINCARGGTVDEKALYDALKNGTIAGAGLDVFENEPPKNSLLLTLNNVVLTPHIGANTKEGQIRAGTVCAEQIIKVLDGGIPDFWVNKILM